jgi:excisionase family DNA binding protein
VTKDPVWNDELWPVSMVAKRLNVSKATVRRMIERGELEAIPVTVNCIRVPESSVKAVLARRVKAQGLT